MTSPQQIAPPTNALALAGFVLGLVSAVLSIPRPYVGLGIYAFVAALLALIFGLVGLNTASRLGGRRRGFAIAAIVLAASPLLVPWVKSLLFGSLA